MTTTLLDQIVRKSLNDLDLNGLFPNVSVAETSFGTSFYIQNQNYKIRISDHSVTNYDRMIGETHLPIDVNLQVLEKEIVKTFSKEYCFLSKKNGENLVNFNRRILKSELNDWITAKVWYQEDQEIPLKLDEIKNWNVLEKKQLTKKGDKRFCRVLKNKYSFGVKNIKTGEVIRTRFFLMGNFETEVNI